MTFIFSQLAITVNP